MSVPTIGMFGRCRVAICKARWGKKKPPYLIYVICNRVKSWINYKINLVVRPCGLDNVLVASVGTSGKGSVSGQFPKLAVRNEAAIARLVILGPYNKTR